MSSDLFAVAKQPSSPDRATKPKNRILAIDGLRAAAFLMVFAFHSWEFGDSPALRLGPIHLGQYIGRFYSGVDLFMGISGFCLMWPLVSKPKILSSWSWRDFAARRIRRIVPPYYAAIALLTILPTFLVILFHVMGKPAKWQ